jgi:hypothetical protein
LAAAVVAGVEEDGSTVTAGPTVLSGLVVELEGCVVVVALGVVGFVVEVLLLLEQAAVSNVSEIALATNILALYTGYPQNGCREQTLSG